MSLDENLMPHQLDAARVEATEGEMIEPAEGVRDQHRGAGVLSALSAARALQSRALQRT